MDTSLKKKISAFGMGANFIWRLVGELKRDASLQLRVFLYIQERSPTFNTEHHNHTSLLATSSMITITFFFPFWALLDSSFEPVLHVQLGRGSRLNKVFFLSSRKLTFLSS